MNAIALQRTVSDMIEEYEAKDAALVDEIEAFEASKRRLGMACSVAGTYGGSVFSHGSASIYERDLRKNLLISGWKTLFDRLQIDRIATADDKRKWESTVSSPPPLTRENVVATFGDYLLRTRFHILRGLAEVFARLDQSYRSHAKVKIGVAGLPKRVILSSVGGYSSYGRDKLRDILNALAAYQGKMIVGHAEFAALDDLHSYLNGHKAGTVAFDGNHVKPKKEGDDPPFPSRGVRIKKFQNGNAHLIFEPDTLLDINRALAEFYGDVLPDAEGEEPSRAPSTAVAKDLQFYPTPDAVIREVIRAAGLDHGPRKVLEPSCGDGRVMDALRSHGHDVRGFEFHPGRAATARMKGHAVVTDNFLEQPPQPIFDAVLMNPPFYGRHYLHHVRHALKFVKPGGRLVTILPASAWHDHDDLKGCGRAWHDLPVASFAESGTNIPTGYLIIHVPRV